MTKQEAKDLIARTAKELYHRNMLNLFEGNVSMRWGDTYLITPSQTDKETMTGDMIVEIAEDGTILNPECGTKPSSEYKMHIQAYKIRPDVDAVIHDHSTYATAYAVAGKPIRTKAFAEVLEIFQEIPVVPYGTPGTSAIADGFSKYLPDYNIVLLENHGVLAVAPNLQYALAMAEAVEKTAHILILAELLGGEKPLPDEEVELLRSMAAQRQAYTVKKLLEAKGMTGTTE